MKKLITLILFIGGFIVLIGLGLWQKDRLEWKQGVVDALETQYAAMETTSLDPAVIEAQSLQTDYPILAGYLEGFILPGKTLFVGPKPQDGVNGYDVIAPLWLSDNHIILTHLGWITEEGKESFSAPESLLRVTGVARKPDYSRYAAGNAPDQDQWLKVDIAQMGGARDLRNLLPLVLYADSLSPALPSLTQPEGRWMPRNKHRQYMIFWFAMAGVWVVMGALVGFKSAQRQG